jgi:hypothetical protein
MLYANVLLGKTKKEWAKAPWKEFSKVLEEQCTIIYCEVRNMLLLDPMMNFQLEAKAPKIQELRQVKLSRRWPIIRLPVLRRNSDLELGPDGGHAEPTQQTDEKLPFFRAWRGGKERRKSTFMRSTLSHNFRGDILTSAGLKEGEIELKKETPKASLADLRDEFILEGAFKMKWTNDPSLHLRFDETDFKRPTLMVLDTRTVLLVALLDLTGLMRFISY